MTGKPEPLCGTGLVWQSAHKTWAHPVHAARSAAKISASFWSISSWPPHFRPFWFFFKSWRRQERDWVLEYTQTKGNLRENMVSFAVHHMAVKCPFRTSFLVAKLIKVACSVMVCNLTFTFFVIYVPWFGRVCFKRDLRIFPIYLIIFISLFFERLPLSLQTRILYPWYPRCMSNCHYILLKWKTFYYSAYLSSSSSLLGL